MASLPTDSAAKIAMLLVAAGRGTRFGTTAPKQYHKLGETNVLATTIFAIAKGLPRATITCVIHEDDLAQYSACIAQLEATLRARLLAPVMGGPTRQSSVYAGLLSLQSRAPDIVLIHDGVRPFVSAELLQAAIDAAQSHGAALPGLLVTDTVKKVNARGKITETLDRKTLRAVQTPQAFRYNLILSAHHQAASNPQANLTDDAAVAELAGYPVFVFAGDTKNRKITMLEDVAQANSDIFAALPDVRIGQGFDVHAFGSGNQIWLGGVSIAHTHGLVGHSDADVLLHAITDAILGALADGDIGAHFPPSDPKWRGAASALFLKDAMRRVLARSGRIVHIDATLICEHPKIGPHREAIRASIAAICGLTLDRVAVKATTSERLGFTGRGEGIAAMALATLRLPA